MSILNGILLLIVALYLLSMLLIIMGWLLSLKKKRESTHSTILFTIIIPFRNEQDNFDALITSFSKLKYSREHVEFIFIDDHSTDNSESCLQEKLRYFPFLSRVEKLQKGKKGKKNAINLGVSLANYSNIVTTDADCVHSPDWLLEMSTLIENGTQFIVGPVINEAQSGILSNLQQIESLLLAGITVGSAYLKKPLLCSGANLTYSKPLYESLNPYKENFNILSGDDMFFLEKVLKSKSTINIGCSSQNIVQTRGANSFKEMLSRSVRWASKSGKLNLFWTSFFSAIVLITNYSMLFMVVMFFFDNDSIVFFIKLCGIKAIIDVLFLILLVARYNRYSVLFYFPLMVVFYPVYLVIVSLSTILSSSKWKGR